MSSSGGTASVEKRRSAMRELGLGAACELPQDDPGHVYHMYIVRSPERDSLLAALRDAEIGHAVLYPTPLHLQPVFRRLGYEEGSLPETERASRENLALPVWAGIRLDQQQRVVECVLRGSSDRSGQMRLIARHRIWQAVVDGGLIAAAWWLAFWLRFDNGILPPYERLFEKSLYIVIPIQLGVFILLGFYNHWWRYVSIRDMWTVVRGVTVAAILAAVAVYLVNPVPGFRLPRSVLVLDWLLLLGLVAGARLLVRTIMERPGSRVLIARGREVLVVGAGDAGQLIVKELQRNSALGYAPVGLVDDDPRKKNLRLHGIRVLGTTHDLAEIDRGHESRRGDHRDSVRAGRDSPAHRDCVPGGRCSRQDAPDRPRADRRLITSSCASCATCRSRTFSGASPYDSISEQSPPTSPARPCS